MIIAIGADHRGIPAVASVAAVIRDHGHEPLLLAPPENTRIDYPAQAWTVARAIVEGRADRGILLSGSGLGMSIAANRIPGIRAVVGHDEWSATISRSHHNSNILTLPTDMIGLPMILRITSKWLQTEFEGGRHARRLAMIEWIGQGHDPASMPPAVDAGDAHHHHASPATTTTAPAPGSATASV